MRFEAHIKRDKLKPLENILTMCIGLIKSRQAKYAIYFIYVAGQDEIRILVQSQATPIVIVLYAAQIASKMVSVSKSETNNSSIGFQLKNGLSFLENLLVTIREDSENLTVSTQEDKTLFMKLTKEKDFRALQLKSKNKVRRQQIQKPNKNQNQLFTYQWIDGVTHSQLCLQFNPAGFVQILKVVNKAKNHYMIQVLEEKKMLLIIDVSNGKLNLKLKTQTSPIQVFIKFVKIEGLSRGRYEYDIKIEDAEILMLAMKNQCILVVDEEKNLSVSYANVIYNCHICLKNLITLIKFGDIEPQNRDLLKHEV